MTEGRIVVGRVTKTHGVRGEIRVQPFTVTAASLLEFKQLYFKTSEEEAEAIRVASARVHKNVVLLKLSGIHTLDAASRLIGADIFVPRSALPRLEPDEFYWTDLIGLTVFDEAGHNLGARGSTPAHRSGRSAGP